MQFIAASLGVECEFCHVQGAFDKDDKKTKKTAREMITMMMAINKENFEGHREVTCFTCHRGSNDPVGTPIISDAAPKPEAENAAAAAKPLPTSDAILDKYLQAVGGREAAGKNHQPRGKGFAHGSRRTGSPDRYLCEGARTSAFRSCTCATATASPRSTATKAGSAIRDVPTRPMSEQDNNVAKLDADLHFAADVKTTVHKFPRARLRKNRRARSLSGESAKKDDQPPVRLYFDAESGLLVRMIRYTETPLGRNPSQVDFADYRDADGVKIPFRWTLARPGQRFTIQVNEVKQNVPVDDTQFNMPGERPQKPIYR